MRKKTAIRQLVDAQTSQLKAGEDLQKVLDRMGNIGSPFAIHRLGEGIACRSAEAIS